MSFEFPDQQYFQAACGYLELGLYLEAHDELENVDPFNRAAPEVLALRVEIYCGLQKWELMAEISHRLAEFEPNEPQWRISCAYAIRRFQGVDAAREILLAAESKFPNEAVIKFNLACYESATGNVELAKEYLRRCFAIDPNWRQKALDDNDLEPVWDSLSQNAWG